VRDLGTEQEVRAAVREINQRVAAHLRHPTGPRVIVRPASPDDVVAGWRASRVRVAGAGAGSPVEGRAGEPGPEPRARERRRRWFWRRGR
jgi:hypothetical protein